MPSVSVDKAAFGFRILRLFNLWISNPELFGDVDSISVPLGPDELMYAKSSSLYTWLFGYEIPDSVLVLCLERDQVPPLCVVHFLSGRKKIEFVKPLQSLSLTSASDVEDELFPKIVLYERQKGDACNSMFSEILSAMNRSGAGKHVGVFQKDTCSGDLIHNWKSNYENKFSRFDVTSAFAQLFSVKDEKELVLIRKACHTTCLLFSKFVKKEIVSIVDQDKKVKHSRLTSQIESALFEGEKYLPPGVSGDIVEHCFPPILQSGGKYQLKFSTASDEEKLHFGTIIICLGVRYKTYCSSLVRTMMVMPDHTQKEIYTFLLEVYQLVLTKLIPGTPSSDVYNSALSLIEGSHPVLKDKFTKNIGFPIGIEFRENVMLINSKNTFIIQSGMVLNINLGFSNLSKDNAEDKFDSVYALYIGDTIFISEQTGITELTGHSKKKINSVCIFFGEDESNELDQATDLLEVAKTRSGALMGTRTRTEVTSEVKRRDHQKDLAKQINEDAKRRLMEGKTTDPASHQIYSNTAYKNSEHLPSSENSVKDLKLFVDKKHEALVVPIFGMAVPFHISNIKSVSKHEEGHYTYLRINLNCPGSTIIKQNGSTNINHESVFVKEVSFRGTHGKGSNSAVNLDQTTRMIKELQKNYRTREAERREMEGIVKQEALILQTKGIVPRLKDLYIRPTVDTKKLQGTIEAHTNGFRYTSRAGTKLDILYSNIKHAFFQPSKGEMVVIIHFHLKHHILIGKKKNTDVQVFAEVGEGMSDLHRAHYMHDRDDEIAEQMEREERMKMDALFNNFRTKVEALQHFEFDLPYKELGFDGSPFRSHCLLQPTTNCLVNLTDHPVFVITLDEVELVHFERIQFHMKNFDMIFVFKDYNHKVSMITAIPMRSLDSIKEWLNSCDIKYTEGIQSLNWAKIMKTIVDDPEGFFDTGGWSFLEPDGGSNSEGGTDSDDKSEEYNPSESDLSPPVQDENDSSNSEEYTSQESESGSEQFTGSEESSGKDWSDLEEQARKEDKARDNEAEEDRREAVVRKKRPNTAHGNNDMNKKRKINFPY